MRLSSRICVLSLASLALAVAFFLPETLASVALGIASIALLAEVVRRSPVRLKDFFWFAVVLHLVAFYWLADTVSFFGGFSYPLALAVFLLFAVTGALQFVLCAWLLKTLRSRYADRWLLLFPLAWCVAEAVVPRLFPWYIGHSLVKIQPLVGIAAYGGVLPLSFLVVWGGVVLTEVFRLRKGGNVQALRAFLAVSLAAFLLGGYSNWQVENELEAAPELTVGLIQGNLAAKQKGDIRYFDVNLLRYRELSEQALERGAEFLFWPESVVNAWMSETVPSVAEATFASTVLYSVPLLYGGLAYRERPAAELAAILEKHPEFRTGSMYDSIKYMRFNAAFLIAPAGDVLGRYYKKVLMPFGEYMPFADLVPQIRALSPMTGDFSKGDLAEPLRAELPAASGAPSQAKRSVSIGALICYEDLIPALSSDFARRGANLLVNVTNDAWYGKTAAPVQHHLLAQWRAIETRRYFLRVTNTGYTAVVDPFGRTVASLPIFEEGTIVERVRLLSQQTWYSRVGNLPWTVGAWLVVGFAVVGKRKKLVP